MGLNLREDAKKVLFIGPATKRGEKGRAWPLRKKCFFKSSKTIFPQINVATKLELSGLATNKEIFWLLPFLAGSKVKFYNNRQFRNSGNCKNCVIGLALWFLIQYEPHPP